MNGFSTSGGLARGLCDEPGQPGQPGRFGTPGRSGKPAVATAIWRRTGLICVVGVLWGGAGCMRSLTNSWLDPTTVGHFSVDGRTMEIRTSISLNDSPIGVPGSTAPTPEDLLPSAESYRLTAGDQLNVRIFELLVRGAETQTQVRVDEVGSVRLPVIGTFQVAGLTTRELEEELIDYLDQNGIIRDAQVIIEAMVRRKQTYSLFGATAGPNIYPVPTPDFKLLEALTVAGGLSDAVTDIYVFRQEPIEESTTSQKSKNSNKRIKKRDADEEKRVASLHMSDTPREGRARGPYRLAQQAEPSQPPAEPMSPEDQAMQELMESLAPESPVARRQTPPRDAADVDKSDDDLMGDDSMDMMEPEDAGVADQPPSKKSRWIFLNGKWIEVDDVEPEEPVHSMDDDLEGGEDQPKRSIDWSAVAEEKRQRIIHIDAEALRDGDLRQNIVVRAGDTIRLSAGESGEYYLMGQVGRPGPYSLSGRKVTMKTAIAAAGNFSPLAWPQRCTVYRRMGDREEMIQVDLDRIFAGDDPDFYVKRNDLILVGTHPAATFLAVLRNAFRLTYGFGFVYDRNFADVDITRRNIQTSVETQRQLQNTGIQGLFP